jgi:hypothetical protein
MQKCERGGTDHRKLSQNVSIAPHSLFGPQHLPALSLSLSLSSFSFIFGLQTPIFFHGIHHARMN